MDEVAAIIADLVAAGTPAELIGRVASALAKREPVVVKVEGDALAARRESDRLRKRAQRERDHVTSRDITGHQVTPSPLKERSPTPPKENNPPPVVSPLRSETTARREAQAAEMALAFETFWHAYPNKTAKKDAARAFAKVWRELPAIMAGVERYVAAKPPDRPWMHPATFLNGSRWEDQPAAVLPASRAAPDRGGFQSILADRLRADHDHENQNRRPCQDVQLLPLHDEREPGDGGGDAGGLSGKAFGLPLGDCFKRM